MENIGDYINRRIDEENTNIFDPDEIEKNYKKCVHFIREYFDSNKIRNASKKAASIKSLKNQIDYFDYEIKNWLFEIHYEHNKFLNRNIINILKNDSLFLLYYSDYEFKECTNNCYEKLMVEHSFIKNDKELLFKFIKQYHDKETNEVEIPYLHINDEITKWIKTTYKKYRVNLLSFVEAYLMKFSDSEEDWREEHKTYDKSIGIYNYNYKVKENLFNIDDLYQKLKNIPFLYGKKHLLKLLFLRYWSEEMKFDELYWHEYYNDFIKRYKKQ